MVDLLLEKVRKLNWVLQEAPKGDFSFKDLCGMLSDLTNSNVYLANPHGKILGVHYQIKEDKTTVTNPETGIDSFSEDYSKALLQVNETRANLQNEEILKIFKNDHDTQSKYHTIIPVTGGGERWGTLIITRYEPEFSEEDLVLGEIGATVIGLEIQRVKNIEMEEELRSEEVVKMAISTLSYSENEAVQRIFEELDGEEGILVASKIADRSRITRSVIVNALRKLESAGVIESKSLGMKGTHIKVLNHKFYEQLDQLSE
ncbi:MAG: GTP-sensing pleiotropic transcriptional regulator CodY [Eubacteriaceae bacterium]|nr:GTP-sensing pleiotropic transcriptional regulator CodY [Eubacteriaceae bacterium]